MAYRGKVVIRANSVDEEGAGSKMWLPTNVNTHINVMSIRINPIRNIVTIALRVSITDPQVIVLAPVSMTFLASQSVR